MKTFNLRILALAPIFLSNRFVFLFFLTGFFITVRADLFFGAFSKKNRAAYRGSPRCKKIFETPWHLILYRASVYRVGVVKTL